MRIAFNFRALCHGYCQPWQKWNDTLSLTSCDHSNAQSVVIESQAKAKLTRLPTSLPGVLRYCSGTALASRVRTHPQRECRASFAAGYRDTALKFSGEERARKKAVADTKFNIRVMENINILIHNILRKKTKLQSHTALISFPSSGWTQSLPVRGHLWHLKFLHDSSPPLLVDLSRNCSLKTRSLTDMFVNFNALAIFNSVQKLKQRFFSLYNIFRISLI